MSPVPSYKNQDWNIYPHASRRAQTHTPIQVLSEAKDSVSAIHIHEHEVLASSIDGKLRNYDLRMGMCTVDDVGRK